MVSLSAPRPTGPLVTRLASSPRPALVQEPAASGTAGTVHGEVDQRIELSGAVTVNWAAKAAGLLADEGVGPDSRVLVDLPVHWLSHALALGVLVAGAGLDAASGAAAPETAAPDAVLTDRPDAWTDPATAVLAVVLPRGLEPEAADAGLDPAVVDVAAEIRAQPDALPGPVDHVRPEMPALAGDDDAPAPAQAGPGRARLTRADVRAALRAWDAGHAVDVPA